MVSPDVPNTDRRAPEDEDLSREVAPASVSTWSFLAGAVLVGSLLVLSALV